MEKGTVAYRIGNFPIPKPALNFSNIDMAVYKALFK